ncbi:MAG: 2-oxoacid:acceptor oxidoreductase subunit alpha, partial [Euryarchaeota archaeon]|nr:2-oxoacid:acceptor oxidoreductase subunit alpha [Euryarchaeota archaeon]
GTHGDYESIVYAPNSPQEMLDLTIKAFNTAETLRTPVTVLSDAEIGHMREKVIVPEKVHVVNRKRPNKPPSETLPFWSDEEDLVPPMPIFGEGYELLVTGSTHKGDGTRDVRNPETHEKLVRRLYEKIHRNKRKFMEWEELYTDDAKILVISYGISSRPSKGAVVRARNEGLKVGFFRPKVLWPSPEERLLELAESVEKVILVELSLRGYLMEIQRIFGIKNVIHFGTPRPEVPLSSDILKLIRREY